LFLLYRVVIRGHDDRFNEMRQKWLSFLGFWIFQMVWVFVVSLPNIFVQAISDEPDWGGSDTAGLVLWAAGFCLETAADQSRFRFNQQKSASTSPSPPGYGSAEPSSADADASFPPFLSSGVWHYSRHPNYFGEILCWLGVFLISQSAFDSSHSVAYVSLFSPALVVLLLVFVSGIPLAEQRSDAKFGSLTVYRSYLIRTSPLIPLPPAFYSSLPHSVKRFLFQEFDFYHTAEIQQFLRHPEALSQTQSNTAQADSESV
jgi:steroid 5-alpha reductase family enzyme